MTPDDQLIEELASYTHDPWGFVLWAFPWGEEGTELEKFEGPEEWQRELLIYIGEMLSKGATIGEVVRVAVTSGHGVGKSALVSWLIIWAYTTFPGTRGVVTANTEPQLRAKTWVELRKWIRLFIGGHLLKLEETTLYSCDQEIGKEWRIDRTPWSERNTEAFQGLHNYGKRLLVLFDEASAIPNIIWETTLGALTDADTEIIWCVFGNPTRTDLYFRQCFPGGRENFRWKTFRVDSRDVSFTNKKEIEDTIKALGYDSDPVRVRYRGEFPRVDSTSMISYDLALEGSVREIPDIPKDEPTVLGVDVARQGKDASVIWTRRGLDARSVPPIRYYGDDTMEFAGLIMKQARAVGAALICVDGTGVGGGVVDRLRQLGLMVVDVQFGQKPLGTNYFNPGENYANRRTEIAATARDYLKSGGCIPDRFMEIDLLEEMSAPKKTNREGDQALVLEPKTFTEKDLLRSPDFFDAFCCTFAEQVAWYIPGQKMEDHRGMVAETNYDPFDEEKIYAGFTS